VASRFRLRSVARARKNAGHAPGRPDWGLHPSFPRHFPDPDFVFLFLSNIGKSRRLSPNGDRIQDGQARPSDPPDSPESGRLRDFDRIIQICLDADPDKRFPDARALLDAIEEIC